MNKASWKKIIKANCESVGTYQPHFDSIIDTLSQILESRDKVHKQWIEEGGSATVIHVNKAGDANSAKNPLLCLEMDLNSQALAYWRDLGLSPAGLRKLKADVIIKDEKNGFEKLLASIADG